MSVVVLFDDFDCYCFFELFKIKFSVKFSARFTERSPKFLAGSFIELLFNFAKLWKNYIYKVSVFVFFCPVKRRKIFYKLLTGLLACREVVFLALL